MEIIEGPAVETRPEIPYVGIRVVTPFRGMLGVRDELLAEVFGWAGQSATEVEGHGFLRLHVIDMRGEMDIEVGLVTRVRTDVEGRVRSGVLPAGRDATPCAQGSRDGSEPGVAGVGGCERAGFRSFERCPRGIGSPASTRRT